ncbi:MAG: hypothetical protein Ct9H300mP14_14090 [Gammaproteobacteria bacterium]|nr:MAG: hypothetical protein Ct9H300mP14_14090 [Gammaproteobacteria bacterium]
MRDQRPGSGPCRRCRAGHYRGVGRSNGGLGSIRPEINQLTETEDCHKLSRHDLATACAKGLTGGTTVAATMICARMAGIRVFATGGIGGVHRGWQDSFDISADLQELSQTPVTVVCSGAKSLLDLPATMEMLETLGVPVVGLGTRELPAFFFGRIGYSPYQWADDISEAAQIIQARQQLALGGGELVVVPPPAEQAVPRQDVEQWITQAVSEATASGWPAKPSPLTCLIALQHFPAAQH